MTTTRRTFVSYLGAGAMVGGFGRGLWAGGSDDRSRKVRHVAYAIPPRKGVQEVTLAQPREGVTWMFYGIKRKLVRKESTDGGRTWTDPRKVFTREGRELALARDTAHLTLLHLKSGDLAMVYGGPISRPGRDGTLQFVKSKDSGKTWSAPRPIDPVFAVCRTQAARVLASGRIVVPIMIWISPNTGGESEAANYNLTYSWVYYSDDEGKSWKRSQSELFVPLDEGRSGVTHFEETVIEARKDESLLMLGRTELGQTYQSTSTDDGVRWKTPIPTGLASSYAPTSLSRIPQTGDLLAIWNQVSTREIERGLHRHRLSTAISEDDGKSWTRHGNLESLDDRVRIAAPAGRPQVYRMKKYGYRQPTKKGADKQYPRAPGPLRICYATTAFQKDEVTIAYDHGYGVGALKETSGTRVKVVSLDRLYGRS